MMELDLTNIKDYVVSAIAKISSSTYLNDNLNSFLQRLIDKHDGKTMKDSVQLKASRQLLCSIGIDIKAELVPLSHYLEIFKLIDYTNSAKDARKIFTDCIKNNNLFYRDTGKATIKDFCILVCPIGDWHYYIPSSFFGVVGSAQAEFVHSRLRRHLTTPGVKVSLHKNLLDKKCETGYFWFGKWEEIYHSLKTVKNPTQDVVDKLGLSHFDFNLEENKFFFYLSMEGISFESFRPNATIIDWNNPKTGYLSNVKEVAGRTFSITGYTNYSLGMMERVLHKFNMTDAEKSLSSIQVFPHKLTSTLNIQCDDIIKEGIKRFSNA